MLLNLIVLVIVFLIGFTQFALDYVMQKRKTRGYRWIRIILLVFMFLGLVGSAWIQLVENKNADKLANDVSMLRSQNDSLILLVNTSHTSIVSMEGKIDDLELKLAPFLNIAMTKYPNLSIVHALEKLTNEIAEAKEMAKPNTLSYSDINITKIEKGYEIHMRFKPRKDEPIGQIKLAATLINNSKAILIDIGSSGISVDVHEWISYDRKTAILKFSPMGGGIPAATITVSEKTAIKIEGNKGLGTKIIYVQ